MGRNHKNENTFKFQTFSERLSAVHIDVLRIGKRSELPEDADTFFSEALQKWSDLNRTEYFSKFRSEISDQVQSLPQLLHHEADIVQTIQRHLLVPSSTAVPALLDLVVQLARDLGQDFYGHFASFFGTLVTFVTRPGQSVDILEASFTALSLLFKFLWKSLVKDMVKVLDIYSPLLVIKKREHIRRFAAESIAFLIRKVKDANELFTQIFSRLRNNPQEVDGYGLILFEMMKGVKNQLHSCTTTVLPILLDKMAADSGLPVDKVLDTLCITYQALLCHSDVTRIQIIWTVTMTHIEKLVTPTKSSKLTGHHAVSMETVHRTLKLLHELVSYKNGCTLNDHNKLSQILFSVMRLPFGECHSRCIDILVTLFENNSLPAGHLHNHITQIYSSGYTTEVVFDFTRRVFSVAAFEQSVLLPLLAYCHDQFQQRTPDVAVLQILTELIIIKCPSADTADLKQPLYVLDFTTKVRRTKCSRWFGDYLLGLLTRHNMNHLNGAELWAALVCLPHVRPVLATSCERISKIFHDLVEMTKSTPDAATFCTLHQCLQTIDHVTDQQPHLAVNLDAIIALLKDHPDRIPVLKLADIYVSRLATGPSDEARAMLDDVTGCQVLAALRPNISSSSSTVRLLTLRILHQFQFQLPSLDGAVDQTCVFDICLLAERVPLTIRDYRNKIFHLNKLDYDHVQRQLPVHGRTGDVPLRFLIGSLYNNFSLLWSPIKVLIESHAQKMSRDEFWPVFAQHLEQLATMNEVPPQPYSQSPSTKDNNLSGLERLLQYACAPTWSAGEQADHGSVRYHLWKCMQQFSGLCETKSKTLCPLLFRFLENEYYPSDMNAALTQDLRRTVAMDTNVTEDDDDDDVTLDTSAVEDIAMHDDEDDDMVAVETNVAEDVSTSDKVTTEVVAIGDGVTSDPGNSDPADGVPEEEIGNKAKKGNSPKRKPLTKYLVAHLELFAKFSSPKNLTMEPRLHELYHRLLSHRYQDIQQVSLDCLMTYRYKFLAPYRDNLKRLLADKHFKDEIVLFSVDEERGLIASEHRAQLMPILMRILYGRMISKTGKETSGKQHATQRKTLVLRFLAGCRQEELRVFLDLVFGAFKHYVTDNLSDKVREVLSNVDHSSVLPIRQQQSALHTMEVVFSNLGNLMDSYQSEFLQILTCVTAVCIRLLTVSRTNILVQAVNSLKTLKSLGMARIIEFFTLFEKYEFTPSELDGVFTGVVWPQMYKLPHEGLYSPTPLLKLLHLFSQESRLLPLLSRRHDDVTLLTYVFQLLISRNAHSSVTSLIMEIVDNLLSSSEDDVTQSKGNVPCDPQPLDGNVPGAEFGIGIQLLLPHVTAIVTYLHHVVKTMTSRGSKKRGLHAKDIGILSRLSCHVTDANQCKSIVDLLVPFLARGGAKDETMERDILSSVAQLIERTQCPSLFLWPLSKLFVTITGRVSRRCLCDVITAIANRVPEHTNVAAIVSKMNAWDRRRVDEVDYNQRLDAFSEINDYIRGLEQPDVIYLSFVIHNAAHFLKSADDMSLRDSSAHCLQLLVERLGHVTLSRNVYQRLVETTLLPQIRNGLKTTNEVPRNEFIRILALCVTSFPQDRLLSPLSHFINRDDVEVDVFLNITHIQMHRRARAMRRLIQLFPSSRVQSTTISLYILPVIGHFLSDEYSKYPAVIDAAVDCLGFICGRLPWSKYSQILSRYLTLLTKSLTTQKIMVKVIVAVLDAFHFDLSLDDSAVTTIVVHSPQQLQQASTAEAAVTKTTDVEDESSDVEDAVAAADEGEKKMKMKMSADNVRRIHSELLKSVVPQLKKALAKKAKSEDEHKTTKSKFAEDEEVLRVPIALALVKLLQQFPTNVLKMHLPGLLMKVCEFLRSRANDIRNTARDTLAKILTSLGHTYFPFIVAELQGALKKGYQVHVLVYTVVHLLHSMKPVLQIEMLDTSIPVLVQILNEELFGTLSEEKEVEGVTNKLHEAKAIKSYDGYEILARYVGKGMLAKLLIPLKEILESTNSQKINKKVQEVLKRISSGLIENKDFPVDVMMIFIHGLVNDTLPLLKAKKEVVERAVRPGQQPPSTYLLAKATPRGGFKPNTDKKTNSNILIEFGLQLLHSLLKRSRLTLTQQTHLELLDPFVAILSQSLDAKHLQVISWSIRCLFWLLPAALPSLKRHINGITSALFILLKDYAAAGAAKGDNQELVMACFKTMTVLVRDVRYYTITTDQLRVLLLYVEEDVHDTTRQASAFTLLKAILIRQLRIPEMDEVMMKLCKLSVTSDSALVRQRCRHVIMKFLLDYPMGKRVKSYLEFYVAQLSYELESGRESVLEMIASLFVNYPVSVIETYCFMFFLPLSTRLVNDEAARCRKLTSLAIKALLNKVGVAKRDEMVAIVTTWARGGKLVHQRLAMLLLGLVTEAEGIKFERRVEGVLPLLSDRIKPEQFVQDCQENIRADLDHVLHGSLTCLIKVLTHCPSVVRAKHYTQVLNLIWESVRSHLLYSHNWVRLASAQLYGLLFSAWQVDEFTRAPSTGITEYLHDHCKSKLRGLAHDFLQQFRDVTDSETGDQVVKNLVFIAKAARQLQNEADDDVTLIDQSDDSSVRKLRLDWLIKKMCREATFEGTQNVKSTLKRSCVYKWLAAVAADLGEPCLAGYLPIMLPPLVRDTSDVIPNMDETLKSLAQEVLDFMKTTAGVESFLIHYSAIQRGAGERKEKRKREKAIQAVNHPDVTSRKKIKKNLVKRDAKKRKIASMRPSKNVKKRKLQDFVIADD